MEKYKRVFFIQRVSADYRLDLFKILNDKLSKKNLEFEVFYSKPRKGEKDQVTKNIFENNFIKKISISYFKIFNRNIYFQHFPKNLFKGKAIIIHNDSSSSLSLAIVIIFSKLFRNKVILYGNCRNPNIISKIIIKSVDKYLAYTVSVVPRLKKIISENKINVINNSNISKKIINNDFRTKSLSINRLKILFLGRIQKNKNIEELFIVYEKLKKILKNEVELKIVGSASKADFDLVNDFTKKHDLVSFKNYVEYKDRYSYFEWADIICMPGGIGLHVLDSFLYSTPLFTYENNTHGVELVYLEEKCNKLISKNLDKMILNIVKYVNNENYRNQIIEIFNYRSINYTIENMAKKIIQCLD